MSGTKAERIADLEDRIAQLEEERDELEAEMCELEEGVECEYCGAVHPPEEMDRHYPRCHVLEDRDAHRLQAWRDSVGAWVAA